MSKFNQLLTARFKRGAEKQSKMSHLAEMSSSGKLSSFSGVFRVVPLTESEEELLRNLLNEYNKEGTDVASDLEFLSTLTSEVKAINNQAAILHGERIKKAQEVLKKYRDGAFSSWLMNTYGNRQTPYNFLQYYELYSGLSKLLQENMDRMPRQALYTLATRDCPQDQKEEIIKNYNGETKKQLLSLIRDRFPLDEEDKRTPNFTEQLLKHLRTLEKGFSHRRFKPSAKQKEEILEVIKSIEQKL